MVTSEVGTVKSKNVFTLVIGPNTEFLIITSNNSLVVSAVCCDDFKNNLGIHNFIYEFELIIMNY